MSESSKLWILAAGCLVFAQVCASLLIVPGFALTVFSDFTQCVLLLSGTASLLQNIALNRGRTRLFWGLMTLGVAFWLTYQLLWSYIEVVLRRDVPDPFVGDVVIFLHFVPMMAALALRVHAQQDDHEARLGRLDFVLLLTWWLYLYLFAVIPWQYAFIDELNYSQNLNALYLTEKVVFLAALVMVWYEAEGRWKTIYLHLFGASITYALSSYVANWAILRNAYYTGSLYDLPLAASMGWITMVGVLGKDLRPKPEPCRPAPEHHGVWVAGLGMILILSLPLFAAWSVFDKGVPSAVRNFRLVSTLITIMIMGGMVFLRQAMLDRELIRLVATSQESLENLKRLQSQLIQSEKLAALGQLVGGAAHELNNPLTAMLGYSELLATSGLTQEQRTLAAKIAQQVKRTRMLIASLLNFANKVPGEKAPVAVNSVVQTAVKLSQPQFSAHKIEVQMDLGTDLGQICADSSQLLQVCLHIAGNALHALDEVGGGIFTVSTRRQENAVILEFSDNRPQVREPQRVLDSLSMTRPAGTGVGLSACYGIIEDHGGRIHSTTRPSGGTTIQVMIPALAAPPVGPDPEAAQHPRTMAPPRDQP